MPLDVSATGFSLDIRASNTFPSGFQLTRYADDADPFDLPPVEAAQVANDINGNMVSWSTPTPQSITINVLPGSEEDNNLNILLEANTAKRGRRHAGDLITMVATYHDGSTVTGRNGRILSGSRGKSISNTGRQKSKTYTFAFQDFEQSR